VRGRLFSRQNVPCPWAWGTANHRGLNTYSLEGPSVALGFADCYSLSLSLSLSRKTEFAFHIEL
jgi:hypothetical protein